MNYDELVNPKTYEDAAVADFEYVTEQEKIEIRHAKRDDVVDGRTVAKVTAGPKYVTLLDADRKQIARLPHDTEITVERPHPTEESMDARYRAQQNERIARAIMKYEDPVPAALEKLAKGREEWGGLRDEHLAYLLLVEAEHRVNKQFLQAVDVRGHQDDFTGDLVDILEEFNEHLKDGLVSRYRHRSLSRSTSVMANLLADVLNEAEADFINRPSYAW